MEKSQLIQIFNKVLDQPALLRKGGDQLVYFCPKCHHHKRKLEINIIKGVFHCWVCSFQGHVSSLLKLNHASYDDQQSISIYYKNTHSFINLNDKPTELKLPSEFVKLSEPIDSLEYKRARFYLKKRNVTDIDILRYNIGYCEEGDYKNRIIFPSYDKNNKLNFFIGRIYYSSVKNAALTYKKPSATMNIIGFENLINFNEPINLCEGVFDALGVRNNAIPLFGKYPSAYLYETLIKCNVPKVNVILDNDAIDDAVKICQRLIELGLPCSLIDLPGKDPSVLGFEKTHQLIKSSRLFNFNDLMRYKLKI